MMTPDHFFQISENVGTSGQPTEDLFVDIAAAGYETVINLAMYNSDRSIPDEGSIVAEQGMTYIHLPVPFDKPTVAHLKKFIGIMTALEGSKVWVHCVVNKRVSAFMYHYLTKVKAMDEQQASSPILRKWAPDMEGAWRKFMGITSEELGL